MWDSITEFMSWFMSTIITPIIVLLDGAMIAGHSLFDWLFGGAILLFCVKFIRRLFGHENDGKE